MTEPTTPGSAAAGSDAPAPELQAKARALKPRDAATLIIVDTKEHAPRVLLGKRRMDLKFHPGKYVFPGGRVDKADRTVKASDALAAADLARLQVDMKGGPSPTRARALALAAIRETYEEAGLIIGTPVDRTAGAKPQADPSWQRFFDLGFAPRLSAITFVARAITPPGRPRRFDTRFFCVAAEAIAFRGEPPEQELSDLVWMSIEDARSLDLPPITRIILEDLQERLARGPGAQHSAPVPYYFFRNGTRRRDLISVSDPTSPP